VLFFILDLRQAEEFLAVESKHLSIVTRRVMIEINNFRKLKGVEFKQFILDFVHLQVEYSKKVRSFVASSTSSFELIFFVVCQVQAAWESIIPEIESL
jgi:hypothetical protein